MSNLLIGVVVLLLFATWYYLGNLFVAFLVFRVRVKQQPKISMENNKKEFRTWETSIIVAVRNEAEHIEKCLNSLANQNYDKGKYEIYETEAFETSFGLIFNE